MAQRSLGIHALGGNMPFLGGRRIATTYGERYADWLTTVFDGTGETDYVGYFFLRAAELMAPAGSLGFIATDAIAEGENRRTTLARVVGLEGGMEIYRAETGMPWPGGAAVLVATLFLARGGLAPFAGPKLLNDRRVDSINSRLRAGVERPDAVKLDANDGFALVGCFLRGEGFILSHEEARSLVEANPAEHDVILPFLTGDDLNSSPSQAPTRHVIAFFDRSLEEARRFPAALAVLKERVRPHREALKSTGSDAEHKKYWWRFANTRQDLRAKAATLPRMIATARVSKHTMFSFIPTTCVPSEQVVVFPMATFTALAILQSRIHRFWVQMQATHMGEGIRYSAPECFETFPFPCEQPDAVFENLERLGEQLDQSRREYMVARRQGLTSLYNAMEAGAGKGVVDQADDAAADLAALRELHEDVDRAVLAAYGWNDVAVPPYAAGSAAQAAFEDEIVERLLALNWSRSEG
jgi:hypothetical protein